MSEWEEYEGLDSVAAKEFEALEAKLRPDVKEELQRHRADVEMLMADEIIKRYYYKKGVVEYRLRTDDYILKAKALLQDEKQYKDILSSKK